jgi:threonine aldolase
MNFASDNGAGVAPEILEAIVKSSRVNAPAYGADDYTARAEALLSEVFERRVAAFLVSTGTAANALALGALVRPWEAVFCHEEAHIQEDECGAPEFFTAGAKLVGIAGAAGKISPDGLRETLVRFPRGPAKSAQPAALSLSQASEAGTFYRASEIAALAAIAHEAGLAVHMDGARFANAVVAAGGSPADMTWRVGVDALSLGATKNGALACEAVVFFDPDKAARFAFQRKRAGQTLSKGRFLGAQMEAYLTGGLWLDLARRANAAARRLAGDLA